MQNSPLPADVRTVLNIAFKIGVALDRKFEVSDMTVELRQAARMYAATYQGDFEYMVTMRDAVASSGAFLSDGQAKGVLNCLMADARRRLAAKPQASPATSLPVGGAVAVNAPAGRAYLTVVPDGRYRVTLADGDHLAIKLHLAGKDSKFAGSRIVSTRISGDEWMGVAHITEGGNLKLWRSLRGDLLQKVITAVDVLDGAQREDAWLVAGLAFAQEGSVCFICGRDLDTPESLTAGYGPICADKNGLPWGDKAVPMSVRLAQAEGEAPSEPTVAPTFTAPVTYIPREYKEDPRTVAERERYYAATAQAKAEGRPRTYEDIFGEEAS
jgi:hypothetical protein